MKRILYIVMALFIFTTVANAQGRSSISPTDSFGPVDPVEHSFKMDGVELSTGTFDKIDDKCWGNSYVAAGDNGNMAVQFTVSLDYVSGNPNAVVGNSATRGTWTLAVYRDGQYQGTIYGEMIVGFLSWKIGDEGLISRGYLESKLRVTGGTGTFETIAASRAHLSLRTDYTLAKPITSASLVVSF